MVKDLRSHAGDPGSNPGAAGSIALNFSGGPLLESYDDLVEEQNDLSGMRYIIIKSEMIYRGYDMSLSSSHAISVDTLALPCLPSSERPAPPLAPYWSIFLASLCAGVREPVKHALFVKEEEEDIFGT